MKKSTQEYRIVKKLLHDNFVTRNEALRQYPCISRLSGIILRLKEEGWDFTTEDTGKDYIYTVTRSPFVKVTRTLSNGQHITNYQKV